MLQSFNAGLAYATLLALWDWWSADPLFGSYILAFAFRAPMFGGLWYGLSRFLLKRKGR